MGVSDRLDHSLDEIDDLIGGSADESPWVHDLGIIDRREGRVVAEAFDQVVVGRPPA